MSVRFLIGIVHVLTEPVRRSRRSISAIRRSWVIPGRHSDSGIRFTTVSTIDIGAQSVAVFARPALPHTDATSGNDRKSTRLNSSHGYISYAVFCLKKKQQTQVEQS